MLIDPPMSFATENGFTKAQNCRAFTPQSSTGVVVDAATGMLMLTPNYMLPDTLRTQVVQFAQWELVSTHWLPLERGHGVRDSPPYLRGGFATIGMKKPTSLGRPSIALSSVTRAWPIASGTGIDVSYWVAKSKQVLAEDQGLWVMLEARSDPANLVENYFGVSWDNVLVAVRKDRRVEVYTCERGSLPGLEQWKLVASGALSTSISPTPEMFSLALIPIPGRGLSVTFTGYRHVVGVTKRDTGRLGSISFVAPLSSISAGDAYRMLLASPVYVRANPFTPVDFAMAFVTYGASGHMIDAAFPLPYPPTVSPSSSAAIGYVPIAGYSSITTTVTAMTGDGSTTWSPGESQASAKVELLTSDARYTPFVHSYRIDWPSVTATRAPGMVTVDDESILALEVTDDIEAPSAATATVLVPKGSDAFAKVKRPDFVYTLQNREEGGSTWNDWCHGVGRATTIGHTGSVDGHYYRAELQLDDMHSMLSELHVMTEGGFDGQTVASGINKLLTSAGFAPIDDTDFPLAMRTTTIPAPQGDERWKYAPTLGQSGIDLLDTLLRHVQTANTRYRLRFTSSGWVAEPISFEQTPTYVYYRSGEVAGAPWVRSLDVSPIPPEANVIVVQGASATDEGAARLVSYYVNEASLANPSSVDYLGRQRVMMVVLPEAQTIEQVKYWTRQFEREIAHGIVRLRLVQPAGWTDSEWLSPGDTVRVVDTELEEPFPNTYYVLRRSVSVTHKTNVTITYTLSSAHYDRLDGR